MKYLIGYHAFGEIEVEAESYDDARQIFYDTPSQELEEKIYSGFYLDEVEEVRK